LPEVLDLLVLLGLDLVDGDVLLAVDEVELDGNLLNLVLFIVEFPFQLA
jgi:hypothetical protein